MLRESMFINGGKYSLSNMNCAVFKHNILSIFPSFVKKFYLRY